MFYQQFYHVLNALFIISTYEFNSSGQRNCVISPIEVVATATGVDHIDTQ